MTDLREKLADMIANAPLPKQGEGHIGRDQVNLVADAIIAALPDMVD